MKKQIKKVTAALLAGVMLFGLTACGKDKQETNAGPEFVYVPEYISMPGDGESNGNSEVIQVVGNTLYYQVYFWNEETGESGQKIYSLDLMTEGAEPVEVPIDFAGGHQGGFDSMGMKFDKDGSLYVVSRQYKELGMVEEEGYSYMEYDYENALYFIEKYQADGTRVYQADFTQQAREAENPYIQYMELDGEGNLYLCDGDRAIWVFDSNGALLFQLSLNDWIYSMGTSKDGGVYVVQRNTAGQIVLSRIDPATKNFGSDLTGLPSNFYEQPQPGIEKDFLIRTDRTVYEYDAQTQTYEELFSFLDSDINGDYVRMIAPLEDGRIFAFYQDWSSGETDLILLTKTDASTMTQKEYLTLGVMYLNQDLQSAVVNFNKTNEQYRITIKDYSADMGDGENAYEDAITRMNNDILTGNAPDLISLDNVNVQLMASKGVFEDMTSYLENSEKIHKEDIVQSVLEAYTINDTLCAIPTSFYINTLISGSSIVGDEMGWTLDEMLAVVDQMPEGSQIMEYATKESILYYMLAFSTGDFINWETGECYFDSENFVKVLEFVNRFQDEYNYDEDQPSMPELVREGKLLLVDQTLSDMGWYQVMHTIWGEPITCIGFPSSSSNGSALQGQSAIAISSKSKQKDAAWQFVESLVAATDSDNDMYRWGFPILESKLQEVFDEAMKPEYETDWETGEIRKDEEGNPVERDKGGYGWGNSNETFYIYAATQEEVDAVRNVIDSTTTLASIDMQLINIIKEEAAPFFAGQKSAQEAAEIIQSRIQVYVDEVR